MTKYSYKIIYFLFLFLLASVIPMDKFVIYIGETGLKYYQIFSLIFIPILLCCSLTIPPKIVCLYFFYITLISILMSSIYGLRNPLIIYIWGFFMIIAIYSIGKYLKKEVLISIFQKIAILFLIIVWIKNFIYKESFIIFFINPNIHPVIFTFSDGGVNLEATWVALLGFFFRSKKGYLYLFTSSFLSILYTSRVGMILNTLYFCWLTYHIYLKAGILNFKRILQISFISSIIGVFFLFSPLADVILNRLSESGNPEEGGSAGRIAMWINFPDAFADNLFGCGAGNAMNAIESVSGRSFEEGNIHNVYMQNALDFGLFGLFLYIIIVFAFLLKERKTMFSNPFAGVLLGYILASLIQFGGSESLLFIFVGFYFASKKNEEVENV